MVDFVFITHLPSFYKVHLYNELARRAKVHVIFLGTSSLVRACDFLSMDFEFEATFLSVGPFETRSKLKSCLKLRKVLKQLQYQTLIVGGWEQPEFWLSVFQSPVSKNGLALESGSESQVKGFKANIKRAFLSRISTLFATGRPQVQLARHLQFSKEVLCTKGVGLFKQPPPNLKPKFEGKFLFVGRLAAEKNLSLLIAAFQRLPQFELTLVGSGPLKIEQQANIHPLGHVPLEELPRVYQQHDVLILPSLSEPWGLVVEEALYQGLPVIVSEHVGAKELVEDYQVGLTFDPHQLQALMEAIVQMAEPDIHQAFKRRLPLDFTQRDDHQVETYLKVVL